MDSSVYANKDFIQASKRWVNLYCSKDTDHGTEKVNGEDRCKLHPSIKCDDHVRVNGETGGKYFQGSFKAPATVWCDATGKEIGKQQGSMSSKQLIEKMKEAEKAVGEGIGLDEWNFCKERLAAAEKALSESKVKEAIDAYTTLQKSMAKTPGAKPWLEKAAAGLAAVGERGAQALESIKEVKAAGDLARAKTQLQAAIKDFKGLPVAKEFEKLLAEVEEALKKKK